MRRFVRIALCAQLALGALNFQVAGARAAGPYVITDLGSLGSSSEAWGVNDLGMVAGTTAVDSTASLGFRWIDGEMTTINSFGGARSEAFDINDQGVVVGWAQEPKGSYQAYWWAGTDPHPMGTLGGTTSRANAVNDDGLIVGYSTTDPSVYRRQAFYWDDSMHALGSLSEGGESEAHDVNGAGVIVGEAEVAPGVWHAFRYEAGLMSDLGAPSPNFDGSWARGINNAGAVVGGTAVSNSGTLYPFIWQDGDWEVVTGQPGYADAVNAVGQVVGTYFTPAGEYAFLYQGGEFVDLTGLLPAASGWQLHAAFDINDLGQIVGVGLHDGNVRGFLMTPVEAAADLGIDVTASPDPLLAGSDATFVMTITNEGPSTAGSVVLQALLPVNNTSVTCSVSAGGVCAGSGAEQTVTFDNVAPGSPVQATFVVGSPVSVVDGASYTASAQVSANEPDPDPSNNAASASLTISNRADLELVGVADRANAKRDQLVTFIFVATNHGPGAAGDVVVSDWLPNGLAFVSATSSVGDTCELGSAPQLVRCSLGQLPSGAAETATVVARVTTGGGTTLVNSATVSSPNADPLPGNETVAIELRIVGPRKG